MTASCFLQLTSALQIFCFNSIQTITFGYGSCVIILPVLIRWLTRLIDAPLIRTFVSLTKVLFSFLFSPFQYLFICSLQHFSGSRPDPLPVQDRGHIPERPARRFRKLPHRDVFIEHVPPEPACPFLRQILFLLSNWKLKKYVEFIENICYTGVSL